jgi:CheY-like chemotaxis protein
MSLYKHILLIDDSAEDREFIKETLEALDSELLVSTANNGLHALQVLNSIALSPDLILLDRNMPMMDGREFLLTLRRGAGYVRFQQIPVVMLTNAINAGTEKFEQDISLYITKPSSPTLFRQMLSAILMHDVVQDSVALRTMFPLAWKSRG